MSTLNKSMDGDLVAVARVIADLVSTQESRLLTRLEVRSRMGRFDEPLDVYLEQLESLGLIDTSIGSERSFHVDEDLEVAVGYASLHDRDTEPDTLAPDELLQENAELFREKNADYGDAWRLAGETMATWARQMEIQSIDPQDPRQMVSLCLYVQRFHKLARGFNLEFSGREPTFEDALEAHRDESTYAAIHGSYVSEEDTY